LHVLGGVAYTRLQGGEFLVEQAVGSVGGTRDASLELGVRARLFRAILIAGGFDLALVERSCRRGGKQKWEQQGEGTHQVVLRRSDTAEAEIGRFAACAQGL